MLNGRSIVAVIPARGGSKGIPRKNIAPLAGKPLIAHTILAARASRYMDRIILSSDDPEIIAVAREWGCEAPFVRPPELAGDTADGLAVIRHALKQLSERYDYVVNLQPTSPLRDGSDIDAAIALCIESGARNCASVSHSAFNPVCLATRDSDSRLSFIFSREGESVRRQDVPTLYALNGAIFITEVAHLVAGGSDVEDGMCAYVMPAEKSIDIDMPDDLRAAENLLQRHRDGRIA